MFGVPKKELDRLSKLNESDILASLNGIDKKLVGCQRKEVVQDYVSKFRSKLNLLESKVNIQPSLGPIKFYYLFRF